MKAVFKLLVVGLMVFALSFAPALAGIVQAGGINYEGFSSYKTDGIGGFHEGQTRGVMFNFTFGGPNDYKENSSIQDVLKRNLTTNQKVGIGLGVIGIFVLLLIADDDDDCIETNGLPPVGDILGLSQVPGANSKYCGGEIE